MSKAHTNRSARALVWVRMSSVVSAALVVALCATLMTQAPASSQVHSSDQGEQFNEFQLAQIDQRRALIDQALTEPVPIRAPEGERKPKSNFRSKAKSKVKSKGRSKAKAKGKSKGKTRPGRRGGSNTVVGPGGYVVPFSVGDGLKDSRFRRKMAIPRPFAAEVGLTSKGRTLRRLVRLSSPSGGQVRVQSLGKRASRAYGRSQFAVRLTRTGGAAAAINLGLDSTGIMNAFGGYYRNRLRLQAFADCGQARSADSGCQRTDLVTRWARGDWLNAAVDVGSESVVVAVTSDVSGAGANYEETPTSPATTWSHGGSSGGFSYSIPISVPTSVGGQAPRVALSYSSQVTDARSTGSNAQSSWMGEGWDYDPGYVEYQFDPCIEDKNPTGDLCWPGIYPKDPQAPAATVTLNGVSTQLLWDGSVWRMANDDGSRVTLVQRTKEEARTGASDGDYWRIDTVDGTSYFFGFGQSFSDSSATNSVSWVPVFGDERREPCKSPGEAESKCRQPSQLHLDRVVDRNGNVTEFSYSREMNKYQSQQAGRALEYVSATYPDQIRYGMNGSNKSPQAMVDFGLKRRCIKAVQGSDPFSSASCEGEDVKDPRDYPDVPGDLICRNDNSCRAGSPTFFEGPPKHRTPR